MEVKALHILWHRNLKFENNILWIGGQTCAVEFSAKNLFGFLFLFSKKIFVSGQREDFRIWKTISGKLLLIAKDFYLWAKMGL